MKTKYLIGGLRMRTYTATRAEWLALATELEAAGEKRLAESIRNGVNNRPKWYDPLPLRFRDGSVAKLDEYAL